MAKVLDAAEQKRRRERACWRARRAAVKQGFKVPIGPGAWEKLNAFCLKHGIPYPRKRKAA